MTELIFIMILSVVGFVNAYFLHWQYKRYVRTKQKMYCLIGEDCAKVVSSRFGITLGIKNEVTGMLYYTLIFLTALVTIIFPEMTMFLYVPMFLASLLAALFSFYLLYVQTKILKTFCSWCLIAIGLNAVIIFFTIQLVV